MSASAPTAAVARFPALGAISGDWGGGYDVGLAALGAAVRSVDGRGPETVLAHSVPAYFGQPDPVALMTAIHVGEIAAGRVVELPPVVFDAVRGGDAEASAIILQPGDRDRRIARAAILRLGLQDTDPPVVLGGGLLVAGLPLLDDAVREGIQAVAARASVRHVDVAPVVGAALLALEEVGGRRRSQSPGSVVGQHLSRRSRSRPGPDEARQLGGAARTAGRRLRPTWTTPCCRPLSS